MWQYQFVVNNFQYKSFTLHFYEKFLIPRKWSNRDIGGGGRTMKSPPREFKSSYSFLAIPLSILNSTPLQPLTADFPSIWDFLTNHSGFTFKFSWKGKSPRKNHPYVKETTIWHYSILLIGRPLHGVVELQLVNLFVLVIRLYKVNESS